MEIKYFSKLIDFCALKFSIFSFLFFFTSFSLRNENVKRRPKFFIFICFKTTLTGFIFSCKVFLRVSKAPFSNMQNVCWILSAVWDKCDPPTVLTSKMLRVVSIRTRREHHLQAPLSVSHASVLKARLNAVSLLFIRISAVLSLPACHWCFPHRHRADARLISSCQNAFQHAQL